MSAIGGSLGRGGSDPNLHVRWSYFTSRMILQELSAGWCVHWQCCRNLIQTLTRLLRYGLESRKVYSTARLLKFYARCGRINKWGERNCLYPGVMTTSSFAFLWPIFVSFWNVVPCLKWDILWQKDRRCDNHINTWNRDPSTWSGGRGKTKAWKGHGGKEIHKRFKRKCAWSQI